MGGLVYWTLRMWKVVGGSESSSIGWRTEKGRRGGQEGGGA